MAAVNVPAFSLFPASLEYVGVAADDIERIVARVEDYVDADGDLTLNGAEDHDYRQHGMPPPLNWIMASPLELKKVLGVGELLTPAQWRRLRPLLTVRPVFGYNFNMMRPGDPGRSARSRRAGGPGRAGRNGRSSRYRG